MLNASQKELLDRIEELKAAGRYPYLPTILSARGEHADVEGAGEILMFASCDYLGLSQHAELKAAAIQAIREFGTNTFGAQIFCGYTSLHRNLERALASLAHKDAALLFPSGMHANIGVISTLFGSKDVVIQDRLNHVSLFMGAKLSGATQRTFRHSDMSHLEQILSECQSFERRLIVTDGVFSADGDLGKISEICRLGERYDAAVMVDEAHGLGVYGLRGCGASEHHGCLNDVDIIAGTMSKAFGSVGGFVAASEEIVSSLRHASPSYTSSRGLPPSVAASSLAAIRINCEDGTALRAALRRNIDFVLQGLRCRGVDCLNAEAACIPVMIGSEQKTFEAAHNLLDRGVLVSAMVPPAVPPGTSRLRIGITTLHRIEQLEKLISLVIDVRDQLDF